MRILILLLLVGVTVSAQSFGPVATTAESDSLALRAYLASDLDRWEAAIAAAGRISDPERRLLTLAEYYLAKSYHAIAASDDAALDHAMEKVDDLMDEFWELNEQDPAAHGIYAGLLGLKIARRPITGIIHGSRAAKYARKGVELDPRDPTALYHAAGNLFYTPAQWGGDSEQALEYLRTAVDLYGAGRDSNWRYLSTLALMGQVQAELGQTEGARTTYELALEAQPDFYYVSRVLLPRLQ